MATPPDPSWAEKFTAGAFHPHRAQIYKLYMFDLILLLKLDQQFPVEQFEATLSQSTVPSLPS